MRKKLIIALILLNALLALAQFIQPAGSQIIPLGLFDCCQSDGPGDAYCCANCCWFVNNCNGPEDCTAAQQ